MFNLFSIAVMIAASVLAYCLGSVNFAIIFSKRFASQDIREFGSGNAGLTNMLRTFGWKRSVPVLLGDFLKGFLAVLLGQLILRYLGGVPFGFFGGYWFGLCAILGHVFPVFFSFKGGKGILIGAGVMLAIDPAVFLILLGVFLIVLLWSGWVSLSSICASVALPISTLALGLIRRNGDVGATTFLAVLIAALVIWKHRTNIQRLIAHTEPKLGNHTDQK